MSLQFEHFSFFYICMDKYHLLQMPRQEVHQFKMKTLSLICIIIMARNHYKLHKNTFKNVRL